MYFCMFCCNYISLSDDDFAGVSVIVEGAFCVAICSGDEWGVVIFVVSLIVVLRCRPAVHRFVRVSDVEEKVFFVVLLVEAAHGGRGGGDDVVDEEKEGVLRPQTDPLPDQEVELAHRQVRGHQVLLLVQLGDPGLGRLLHDDGHAVRILPADLLALGPSLLEGMLFLVLPLHFG